MLSPTRVWKRGQIFAAAFVGGPLAGLYLLSKNFEAFGNQEAKKRTLLYGSLTFVLLMILVQFIPWSLLEKLPKYMIPMVCALTIKSIADHCQKKPISESLENGAKRHAFWRWCFHVLWLLALQIAFIIVVSVLFSFTNN